MAVQDFVYETPFAGARDGAGLPVRVAVFADRDAVRRLVLNDLTEAGFCAMEGGTVEWILADRVSVLGDIVMLDCPDVDAQILAALHRLDTRVSRSGSQLIVSTTIEALDDVFAAFSESAPQILINPSRAERLVSVGRVAALLAKGRVREMDEQDRLALLRLSQQVDAIAQQLGQFSKTDDVSSGGLSELKRDFHGSQHPASRGFNRSAQSAHPPLPDPRTVRRIIANRQARAKFFDAALFADPAWDMLLDLTAAYGERRRVSVTSLCIAAGVPATTALRWIKELVEAGVFVRISDTSDKRRAFVALSDQARNGMACYFAAVENPIAEAA